MKKTLRNPDNPRATGPAARGRKNKQVNVDARGNSLSGQPVGFNARTGDILRTGEAVYKVLDSFPNSLRLSRKTRFGDDITVWTYDELSAANAAFV